MQIASKNRFVALQFSASLKTGLWKTVAAHTNQLARLFEKSFIPNTIIRIAYPVPTNVVFLNMPEVIYHQLKAHANCYYWNPQKEEVRLVFSFSHTAAEVLQLAAIINALNQPNEYPSKADHLDVKHK